ncbi:MAG: WD40 repeat domain-containing protein [Verrucomicrobia bacterium]|nr:WD40 repeat domain-containing protein [Verrucomicrobiota bacterium]
MKQFAAVTADDNIISLAWGGDSLAATPSTGEILILDAASREVSPLGGHGLGNGDSAWFHGSLATCGYDGKIRWDGREVHAGRGIIERVKASADGDFLGAGQGKALLVFDREGSAAPGLAGLPASIADFAWDPTDSSKVAVVGAGGARMWKFGEGEPFARFDWGGASLRGEWSPCGRWLVTADQTASVHIYDFTRDYPLHIQGYETKVRAMAFSADGKRLATGGGPIITIWPCTGKKGPEGVTPIQLDGHDGEVVAAAFSPKTGQLATGDGTGMVLIFTFQGDRVLRKRLRLDAGISALAWHPENDWLAIGREDGAVSILSLES